jgi:hypothetical protein
LSAAHAAPRRVVREVWALSPRLFAVGAKDHLSANLTAAVAEGLRALSPPLLGA